MILIGLTGGIGSGKSTVSSLLAERGAVIIDADAITRQLQQPGQPLLQELADRFGSEILTELGELNRPALAAVAFSDPEALKDLNKIVHPAVAKEMDRQMNEVRHTDKVVVLDIPLLAENPRKGLCGVIVVDVPVDLAVHRLVTFRSMNEADARARIEKQASREKRLEIADQVIDNSGDMESLAQRVDEVWQWALTLPPATEDAGSRTSES
ncbi:MAG: dephospho-CoA kinase [Actinomycetota bacterium]